MMSWQQWHYCECDDPTTSGPGVQSVVGDAAQPPTGSNVNAEKLAVSSRPYPQAVSGTPEGYGFDDGTKEFRLDYSTARADGSGDFPAGSKTEIFIPQIHYPVGYSVDVQGAEVVSAPGARVLTLASCGTGDVSVRVTSSGPSQSTGCGFARPRGASPVIVRLVPAYDECVDPDGTHGAPLAVASCSPANQSSHHLTVGTPEANGKPSLFAGSLRLKRVGEAPINPANGDQADVEITGSVTDVRRQSDLSDYTGELRAVLGLRMTDHLNSASLSAAATALDTPLALDFACAATTGPEGGACNVTTTADALTSGIAHEGKRSIWELGQVQVYDGGADGAAATTADNTLFAVQGLFAP
jgi:hypothetical protein